MLPSDFPKWRTVHSYFQKWAEKPDENAPSLLEQALKNQVGVARIKQGRNDKTRFCIIDAQSVKNTDTAEHKGYDAGKRVSGIKRHIVVDTQGLPHAIAVTTANVTDRAGALLAFSQHTEALSEVLNVSADGGYVGEPFAAGVKELLEPRWRLPSAASCTNSQSFPNVGWSSAHLPGWRNADDYGKTASGN